MYSHWQPKKVLQMKLSNKVLLLAQSITLPDFYVNNSKTSLLPISYIYVVLMTFQPLSNDKKSIMLPTV
jgi:hypothetical protein